MSHTEGSREINGDGQASVPDHGGLSRLVSTAGSVTGKAVGVLSRVASTTSGVWPIRGGSALERYILHENRNPYIATLLGSIYRHNLTPEHGHPVSTEEALTELREKGHEGSIRLFNSVNAANIAGGGGLRGRFYSGQYKAFNDLGLIFWYNIGISIGTMSAVMNAIRRQALVHGPQKSYGIDFSPKGFDSLTDNMTYALGQEEGLLNHTPEFVKELVRKFRALFGESLFDNRPLSRVIRQHFPDSVNVSDIEHLGMVISDITAGNKVITGYSGQYPNVPLHDAFIEAMAFPFAFELIYRDGVIRGDGGLHAPPLKEAFERGADLVYLTLLNYFIPIRDDTKARGPRGIYNRANRMFEIMQRDAANTAITQLTGRDPPYVAEVGDPNGRVLLSLENLSDCDPFKLGDNHFMLNGRGVRNTNNVLDHLDPKRPHPEYNPTIFLEEMALGKKFGDRYKVVVIETGNGNHHLSGERHN